MMFRNIVVLSFIVVALPAQITSIPITTATTPASADVTTTSTPCSDVLSTCNLLDPAIYCVGAYYEWAIGNCARTCNLCGSIIPTTTAIIPTTTGTTPVVPYCTQDGRNYEQGQTWHDGCTTTYTCSNAELGTITSRPRCLTFSGLPSVCRLEEAPPGFCCEQPRCPSGIVIRIPKAYEIEYPRMTLRLEIFG